MRFPSPLYAGTLTRRYKRFLADIVLQNGTAITAHCANPGSMTGVAIEGKRVWVSKSTSRTRKLPYSWELVEGDDTIIAINTNNPNKIAFEAVNAGLIPELTGYQQISREVRYGDKSRIDLLLHGGRHEVPCYLEVKNVHLHRRDGLAEFPDCVTARGTKHLVELSKMAASGARAVMLYIVQRGDCTRFSPARDIDPVYAENLTKAKQAGVEFLCYDCDITLQEVRLRRPLPVLLEDEIYSRDKTRTHDARSEQPKPNG